MNKYTLATQETLAELCVKHEDRIKELEKGFRSDQDIIDNGALYIALLVTIITEVADGRPRNEQDDAVMELGLEWIEDFTNVKQMIDAANDD